MKEHSINSIKNGISGYYIDPSVTDKLIQYHNKANKFDGVVGGGTNKEIKDSTDCILSVDSLEYSSYANELLKCIDLYKNVYEHSVWYPLDITENIMLQRYDPPNGGYHAFHYERSPNPTSNMFRQLVFMTYLNDVPEGGETEFLYQNVKIKPEKGLTLIWSADWFFTHKGNKAPTTKQIATGWISFDMTEEVERMKSVLS